MNAEEYKESCMLTHKVPHPVNFIIKLSDQMGNGICIEPDRRWMSLRCGVKVQKRVTDSWVMVHLPSFWTIYVQNQKIYCDYQDFSKMIAAHPKHIGKIKWRIVKHEAPVNVSLFKLSELSFL